MRAQSTQLTPKASLDARSAASSALERSDHKEIVEQRAGWKQKAEEFLSAANDGAEDKPTVWNGKPFRYKAHEWMVALEQVLSAACDRSLQDWKLPSPPPPTKLWPHPLVVNGDRGSDGYAAQWFLRYGQNCALFFVGDPSHTTWNACPLALKDSGPWPTILLASAMMNADHAPYHEAHFFQEGRESILTYVQLIEPHDCPIYAQLRERLVRDRGLVSELCDPELDDRIWQWLPEAWSHKSERVGPSRWFHFKHSIVKFNRVWAARLLGNLFRCLQVGLFADKKSAMLGKIVMKFSLEGDCGESRPTGQEPPGLVGLRRAAKNSPEFATLVLWDTWVQEQSLVASTLMEPSSDAHSSQNKACRSREENIAHFTCMSVGGGGGCRAAPSVRGVDVGRVRLDGCRLVHDHGTRGELAERPARPRRRAAELQGEHAGEVVHELVARKHAPGHMEHAPVPQLLLALFVQ